MILALRGWCQQLTDANTSSSLLKFKVIIFQILTQDLDGIFINKEEKEYEG